MRNLILSLSAACAAIAVAAPAAAQYYQAPAPVPYGYQQPGYQQPVYQQPYGGQPSYGYQQAGSNWLYNFRDNRYASMMRDRVQRIRGDIRNMAAQRILSRSEFYSLDQQAQRIERKIARSARYNVNRNEARTIDRSVRRLEERVMREATDWNRRSGVRRYNPYNYNQYWTQYGSQYGTHDRDRDGRDDRYEDDGGRVHDHH
ncbi:MAG: hypothetical protein ABIO29_08390 [Sphingomicrobium sp.]